MRVRRRALFQYDFPHPVSIHAPVRVRLLQYYRTSASNSVSIHAPVRVRPDAVFPPPPGGGFNPRTREGATPLLSPLIPGFIVSIHAPVRVRLLTPQAYQIAAIVSIHAPVRVRQDSYYFADNLHGFNPRTHEGATGCAHHGPFFIRVSIHAPMRVRLCGMPWDSDLKPVSIHAPMRVRLKPK